LENHGEGKKEKKVVWRKYTMVEFVKISEKGTLLEIKEVSDKYRYLPYDELAEK
jgi:hypothetical protein